MKNNARQGFTLIEMMVAMALTMFVMVILSQAFVLSMETFSAMKGIGDMQINLRVASTLLRDDLSNDHFEGRRRLTDADIVSRPPRSGFFAVHQGSANSSPGWNAATAYKVGSAVTVAGIGYMCIQAHTNMAPPNATYWITPARYTYEGLDSNGMPSYRATDHVLYMTVKRKGNRREDFFNTSLSGGNELSYFFQRRTAYNVPVLPGSTAMADQTLTIPYPGGATGFYASQWAEVVYYLKRTGSTEEPNNPTSGIGTPTFGLYRAEFVMVPDGTELRAPIAGNPFVGNAAAANVTTWSQNGFKAMSCNPANVGAGAPSWELQFYSPVEAARGIRMIPSVPTFDPQPLLVGAVNATTNRVLLNETAVLPNVVSFQIQLMSNLAGSVNYGDIPLTNFPPIPAPPTVPTQARLYDTALFNSPGNGANAGYTNNFGLKAIQITLRVWDNGTRQTRQVTLTQDL